MAAPAIRNVISVSRRTDIPALYSEWFMNRIRAGFAHYRNPFGGKMCEVSLRPDDVMAFVFWSRNYAPLLQYLPELDDLSYGAYFHYTLTDFGLPLEPYTPSTAQVIEVFHQLARRYSPRHVLWRFDPLIYSQTMANNYFVKKFTNLAQQLQGATQRCYISFADFYRKLDKTLRPLVRQGFKFHEPSLQEKIDLIGQFVEIGREYGIRIYACCEQDILQVPDVEQAHCIDPVLLHELFPQKFRSLKPASTREGCGCFASRDIGAYETCIHGCVYCYANSSHKKALARFKAHKSQQTSL